MHAMMEPSEGDLVHHHQSPALPDLHPFTQPNFLVPVAHDQQQQQQEEAAAASSASLPRRPDHMMSGGAGGIDWASLLQLLQTPAVELAGFLEGSASVATTTASSERDGDQIIKGKRIISKPRFAFRTKSESDLLDDGYRWRKYGQKAVKNSAFPRSYYRCTHHTCDVKKQVQRLSKDNDSSIVLTTYQGIHNHPCDKLMQALAPLIKHLHFLTTTF
ncbi:WRKY23 - superfamily of TFs having WRKY and zinc finger domains [Canna indica]|uniref:WRKY23 - superfamily of TFs having WRKY and zinc finger domains n=1 Tax=Canna indica TaxID=4628 RepID=A0AAQ3JUP7_9LILI|nr:WRKY23 - superfamily of TFs having WRKY and zinc finger domains [Canna indica]